MRTLRTLAFACCLLALGTPVNTPFAQVAAGPQLVDLSISIVDGVLGAPTDATGGGIVFPFDASAEVDLGGVVGVFPLSVGLYGDHSGSEAAARAHTAEVHASVNAVDLGILFQVECRLRQDERALPGLLIGDCTTTGRGTEAGSKDGLGGQGTGSAVVELFDGVPMAGSRVSLAVDALVVCKGLCAAPLPCKVNSECAPNEVCLDNVCVPVGEP